jgi:hypothetical protein
MLYKSIKIVVAVLIAVILTGSCLYAEERSVDVSVGLAIQKYLEGDIKKTITHLDEVLTKQPDHKRGRDLMEKAVLRLADNIKETKNFKTDIVFVEIGHKHLPDSTPIQAKVNELMELMNQSGVAQAKPDPVKEVVQQPKAEPVKKEEPQPAAKKIAKVEEKPVKKAVLKADSNYERKISKLHSQIRRLEKKLVAAQSREKSYKEVTELKKGIKELGMQVIELKEETNDKSSTVWTIIVLTLLGFAGFGMIFTTMKTENIKLIRNVSKERKAVEDLKTTYNKDTEELAKKLSEYGKSYQRADQLEKNWEKVIKILGKLTEGGSTHKVVLKDSPGGRKAVTGVDPRVRARADSVEVIAEIFKDSPKAPEMLKPFLDDKDNRTRANAAVAYYRYDQAKAIAILEGMTAGDDKWMRLSAAWALGEIGEGVTSKILEKLLDDPDAQVKTKARASLEKILQQGENT